MLKNRTVLDFHKKDCISCTCPSCSSAREFSKRNKDAITTQAILSNSEFPKTLQTILNQRGNLRSWWLPGKPKPEKVPYYVYKEGETLTKTYGFTPYKVKFEGSDKYASAIKSAFSDIGKIIGVEFYQVNKPNKSLFDVGRLESASRKVYYKKEFPGKEDNILGLSAAYGNGDYVWRVMTYSESPILDTETPPLLQAELDTASTIRHEIGHAFGLSHPGPNQNGFNEKFNQLDTVMSYNITDPANPNYTLSDQAALDQIASKITFTPRKGVRLSSAVIDKSEPRAFNEKTQSVIPGHSEIKSISNSKRFSARKNSDLKVKAKHDYIIGIHDDDDISSGHGSDFVKSGKGNDKIHAGRGHDSIKAGNGHDVIRGGHGTDFIHGGKGDDRISGGKGIDIIKAGRGRDVFVIRYKHLNTGYDSLVGFTDEDKIVLKGFHNLDKLFIQPLDNKSLLNYGCKVVASIDASITFDDHIIVE